MRTLARMMKRLRTRVLHRYFADVIANIAGSYVIGCRRRVFRTGTGLGSWRTNLSDPLMQSSHIAVM
eukprot:11058474-Karenia_brevis.AAC.1